MSAPPVPAVVKCAAIAVMLVLALGGCTYDYLQHSDRVGYGAGDAVRANLESETANPSKRSMYVTSGLGRNGSVMPATAAPATSSGTSSSTSAH